ncbi:class I SAM-dependent methyltransferase [Methylobacterium terricola]|uniref:Class I SAM-dependent methyltransferase n=1 Tax=Methylobacterium terricola TaxID=2583531 RepID=A0A5C4LJ54_9HYPH|nr:class I SAM-dependent methyltransferase [Methylobacterium terricola]TNC13498.1 class I SAM-dependent methyltransferase [Methylobacterium terricola]
MSTHATRRNLVDERAERFKPPVFRRRRSRWDDVLAAGRRLLDLQAGSAWRDLRVELASASGVVLDVGCGAQVFRSLLPPTARYRGIDTRDARDRFGYAVPDTEYFEGTDWNVAPASIDVVLCTEVLEHVEAPEPFLGQVFACLAPGGRLILTVPFAARWHFIPYDYWRYTPSSLDGLLRRAGFREVRVTARGNPVTVACYKAMALCLIPLLDAHRPARRLLGAALLPVLGLLGVIGTLSLASDWGEDCLGYTVTARRPPTDGDAVS